MNIVASTLTDKKQQTDYKIKYVAEYVNPFRYRCYYYDTETNLYYLQSRYYDPNTGRFINADLPDYVVLSETNLFAYCKNNPINRIDKFGYCDEPNSSVLGSNFNYTTNNHSYKNDYNYNYNYNFNEEAYFLVIPSWTIATAIDLIIALMTPTVATTYTTTTGTILALIKMDFYKDYALKLLKSVVPVIKGILGSVLTFIREVFWRIAGVALYFLADGAFSQLMDTFDFIKIIDLVDAIMTLATIGGIFSIILDVASDGLLDEKIRV